MSNFVTVPFDEDKRSQTRIDNIWLENTIAVWGIWDTEVGDWWITPKGKWDWTGENHAKNAVNANPPIWMKELTGTKYPNFSQQTRLVARQIGRYVLQFNTKEVG